MHSLKEILDNDLELKSLEKDNMKFLKETLKRLVIDRHMIWK